MKCSEDCQKIGEHVHPSTEAISVIIVQLLNTWRANYFLLLLCWSPDSFNGVISDWPCSVLVTYLPLPSFLDVSLECFVYNCIAPPSHDPRHEVITLKVPYYTVFHQYITGLRYIQNMSLKCLAPNTKQIIAASHNPLCFSPVSKVLILCLLL